jgi:hypothetical protein
MPMLYFWIACSCAVNPMLGPVLMWHMATRAH